MECRHINRVISGKLIILVYAVITYKYLKSLIILFINYIADVDDEYGDLIYFMKSDNICVHASESCLVNSCLDFTIAVRHH